MAISSRSPGAHDCDAAVSPSTVGARGGWPITSCARGAPQIAIQISGRPVMPVDVKYTTTATATGGRDGRAATKDGAFEVKLARPKELGGRGDGNNPEQLFAAGYAACFLGAMQHVAAQGGPKVPGGHDRYRDRRHRPALGGRLRARHRSGRRAPRTRPGRGRGSGREGAPGVPLLERHARQRTGTPARGLNRRQPPRRPASCSESQLGRRSGRKNARTSSASASGCSSAAKCPPRGITLQRRMSV